MRAGHRLGLATITAAMALGTLGAALAQERGQPPAKGTAKAPAKKAGIRAGGGAPPKNQRKGANNHPMAADANAPEWPFHFKFKIAGADGRPLAASYYPSKLQANAPVLLLIHERGIGRSGKDFEEPIADLKGQSFAEYLQEQEYAVLIVDLRGTSPRREVEDKEWRSMTADLQASYLFLVDLHNRRELNIAKLGVVALGESANLVAAWAASPGGAVSPERAASDLGALVLISPVEDAQGLRLAPALASLAPRVPILLISGSKGADAVKAVKPVVERQRLSKVIFFETPLHGQRLLNFFPGVPTAITKFLEDPIKFKTTEWEPRYLLNPVAFSGSQLVSDKAANAPAKNQRDEEAKKDEAPAKKKGDQAAKRKAGANEKQR